MPKLLVACDGCGEPIERWPSHVLKRVYCEKCRGASGRGGASATEIEERRRLVLRLRLEQRLDSRAIGRCVGIEHTTVLRDLRAMGYSFKAERQERRRRVAALYPERRLAEIAEELGCDVQTVWNDLVEMGIDRERAGRRSIHPPVGQRVCATEGCDVVFTPPAASVALGKGRYHSPSCRARDEWATGAAKCKAWLSKAPVSGAARRRWLGRWTLKEVRTVGRKGEKKGRAVATAALELLARKPDLTKKQAIDILIVRFEKGRAKNVNVEGGPRSSADPVYRRARARIERALARGFRLLGEPPALQRLL